MAIIWLATTLNFVSNFEVPLSKSLGPKLVKWLFRRFLSTGRDVQIHLKSMVRCETKTL